MKGFTDDLRNQGFGRLLVLNEEPFYASTGYIAWNCICDCNPTNIIQVEARRLKSNHTQSCGCLNTDVRKQRGSTELFKLGSDASRKYDDIVIGSKYTTYRANAEAYSRDFDLTYKEFKELLLSHCHYCFAKPMRKLYRIGNHTYERKLNGIDRIENRFGYTKDNVVSCCKSCNSRKRDRSVNYLIQRNIELGIGSMTYA